MNILKTGPRFTGRGPSKGKNDLVHLRGPRSAARGPVFYDRHDIRDFHDIKGTLVPLAAHGIQ